MYSLEIQNDDVYLKNIRFHDLERILEWYNRVDDFQYATGVDSCMTLDMLTQRYMSAASSSNDFFVGIYNRESTMVGILKGRIQSKGRPALWISCIAIDSLHQNKGYGRAAVNLMLDHFKAVRGIQTAYLAVVEDNLHGRAFWAGQKFKILKKIDKHVRIQGKTHNVIIMFKTL